MGQRPLVFIFIVAIGMGLRWLTPCELKDLMFLRCKQMLQILEICGLQEALLKSKWVVKGDILICNSGLSEAGYRFGRALPEKEGESRRERRARVRRDFIERLDESKQVMETKIDGFMYMSHLWAGEAVYHKQPLNLIYISSMQAVDPGRAVPGYVLANWAVLKLPQILDINLGEELFRYFIQPDASVH